MVVARDGPVTVEVRILSYGDEHLLRNVAAGDFDFAVMNAGLRSSSLIHAIILSSQ